MKDKAGELVVVKKNDLVQQYRLRNMSIMDMRIINYLVANIHSPKYDKEFEEFSFDINEFANAIGSVGGNSYKIIENSIKSLADKSAWKEIPAEESRSGKDELVLIRWIEKARIQGNIINLKLSSELAPYLLQVDKGYFQSKFKYTALAKKKHTIPLYELLKSWEKVKDHKKIFEVDELRQYLDVISKSYENISSLKQRVLDPSVNEINEITDLNISYRTIKKGRTITHIEFTINRKDDVIIEETIHEKILRDCEYNSDVERAKKILPVNIEDQEAEVLVHIAKQNISERFIKELFRTNPSYNFFEYEENEDYSWLFDEYLGEKVLLMMLSKKRVEPDGYVKWLYKALIDDWQ